MRIIMLGTGHAVVTKCYNTCFALEEGERRMLVDGGGGSGIVTQLERAGIPLATLTDIFVTHRHLDHILGILWMMRMQSYALASGKVEAVNIYGHDEVIDILRQLAQTLLPVEMERAGNRLRLVTVGDGETRELMDHEVTFFDIGSSKAKQFGFCLRLDGARRLVFCGDEPLSHSATPYARDADWLLHEAFCLEAEQEVFHPYEKHHSTVASACRRAEELGVRNLLLFHAEDTHYDQRRELYLAEGMRYFSGNLHVPYDLEAIDL